MTSFSEAASDTFTADHAASTAAAAGPLLLNLQGVDLGYAHHARRNASLVAHLENHGPLNTEFDEGFKVRGYVYAIEFDSGWIKLGYTTDPLTRINKHVKGLCKTQSFKINRLWLSVPTLYPMKFEDQLRGQALRASDGRHLTRKTTTSQGESETFYGLDFDEIVSYACELKYMPVTPDGAIAALAERRQYQYEFDVRQALYAHLREHHSFDGFSLPTTRFDGPSMSTAPLTDLDLDDTAGLVDLLDRGVVPWRALLPAQPEPKPPTKSGLLPRLAEKLTRLTRRLI
ncbi:hypothetical protein GS584_18270 [Rhodococcus hoagii]|nr:hypothetical protein [Prescottella equi]